MDELRLVEAVRGNIPPSRLSHDRACSEGIRAVCCCALRAASHVPSGTSPETQVVHQIVAMAAPSTERERIIDSLDETRSRFTLPNDEAISAPLIRRLEETVLPNGCATGPSYAWPWHLARNLNAIHHGNLEPLRDVRQDDERIYHRLGASAASTT